MDEKKYAGLDLLLQKDFTPSNVKRKKEFGLKLFKDFWGNVSTGYNSYYSTRNNNWDLNRKYADGKVSHTEFVDKLHIEGNESYINIDWTIAKILPKYKEAILAGFMDRDEEPSVKATDILSQIHKEREKTLAKYRMAEKEKIQQLEAVSGQKIEEGFTPENEDDLDLYYKIEYRLPEEAFFEKTLRQIWNNNNYENFKRDVLSDELTTNVMVAKIETLNSYSNTLANRYRIRRCKPERTFYNIFESSIGEDVSIIGEAYPITIAEARRQYPNIKEEQWFKIAEKCQKGLKQAEPLTWYDSYVYSFTRPYDDYSFMVLDAEIKSIDKDYHVKTENKHGTTVVIPKKGKPNPLGNQEMKGEAIENERFNIYCGVWAIDTEIMLDWDIADNMIRPYQNGVDVFFNYTIVIPNNDGFYQPSLIERGISNVKAMALYKLKIQQMVSLMKADGQYIDIAGLNKLDIGTGRSLTPLQLMRIYDQTGRVYWDSSDTTGTGFDMTRTPPFQEAKTSGNVAQINALIQLYNFELQNLNDEFGVNNDFLGAAVAAKRGAAVNENQIEAANKATEFLYMHYLWFMSMINTKLGYKIWDTIIFESSSMKEMSGMNSDLIDTTFDIDVVMSSKSETKKKLMEMINVALQQKIITLSQAMRLENISNYKDAIMFIEHAEKKAAEAQQQSAKAQMEMNAQVQQQSAMIKAQGDAMVVQAKGQVEAQVEKVRADGEAYKEAVRMIKEATIESIKNNIPIPDKILQLSEMIIGNVVNQSIIKPEQQEQAQQEAAMQEQQAQQEQ